jgi:tetratricopeptide (TPR) repeat protein
VTADGSGTADHAAVEAVRALLAADARARSGLLAAAIYEHGTTLLDALSAAAEDGDPGVSQVRAEAHGMFVRWLRGDRLTDWPDEPARRARALADIARRSAEAGDADAERFSALALLELPRDHPERDDRRAAALLGSFMERCLTNNDISGYLAATGDVLDHDLVGTDERDSLLQAGLALLDRAPAADAWNFRLRAIREYVDRAIDARTAGDDDGQRAAVAQARKAYAEAVAVGDSALTEDVRLTLEALIADAAGDTAAAADWYDEARAARGGTAAERDFALRTAVAHGEAGDWSRAAAVIEPWLNDLRGRYLRSLRSEDVEETGREFATALDVLVGAHIAGGHLDRAAEFADRGKSLRLRFQAYMRRDDTSGQILALEQDLHAQERRASWERAAGTDPAVVDGWVSGLAGLEQQYARERARVESGFADDVALADVSSVLAEDEGAVLLSTTELGMLAVVVTRRSGTGVAASILEPELTQTGLIQLIGADDEVGWLDLFRTPWLVTRERRRALLATLVADVEDAFGRRLAAVLEPLRLRGLVLIPHLLLHLLPYDALPSLRPYALTTTSSAAAFVVTRTAATPDPGQRAAVIANTTGDLPLTAGMAAIVATRLRQQGWGVLERSGQTATLTDIREVVSSVSVLHFAGHGRSDVLDPDRSALFVYPRGTDQYAFSDWLATAVNWRDIDEARVADVRGAGCLTERKLPGDVTELMLERPDGGVVWQRTGAGGTYPAELWTAADMLVTDTLASCRLAVLVACESGGVGAQPVVDEYSGLPAALELAGVDAVVGAPGGGGGRGGGGGGGQV